MMISAISSQPTQPVDVSKTASTPKLAPKQSQSADSVQLSAAAKAALAAGADALLMEIHPQADKAVSDAAQTLYLEDFMRLAAELRVIAGAVGRTM